ncbi:PLC-like phosphodiesterase [Coniochaeta hoffmannii]|uniref:PLC-like phosphodiesterase n=1 Tax=Coniochaeta hoffmannii TaxID=91930 RepID=A0AA38RJE2_9PEZI|nr:PLC-like phosphodiesterase [Coniochaeta hoffmannii]
MRRSIFNRIVTGLPALLVVPAAVAAVGCNGNTAFCSRKYSNVTQIGSHDSAFVGVLPPDNQYIPVVDQLDFGIRFLQAQTHKKGGGIEMCHTSCLELDAGSLNSYLSPIKTWLDGNPNEVLTLLLTNGDAIPVSQFASAFAALGLDEYAYAPGANLAMDQWPTLQSMIDAGKRLVVFMDYHADTSSVPYILDEFAYFFETPYDVTDKSFNQCTLDRPSGASASGRMYIVNHFLDVDIFGIKIPDQINAPKTNSKTSIMAQSNLCYQAWGRLPNLILLDWANRGDPIGAQNALNHV